MHIKKKLIIIALARTYNERVSKHIVRKQACVRGDSTDSARFKHAKRTYHVRNVPCTQPHTAWRLALHPGFPGFQKNAAAVVSAEK